MKYFAIAAAFAFGLGVTTYSVASIPVDHTHTVSSEIVEHGGGCRKDSPQGQCCHAGSQPYHCH